jgi:SAM-dependent methyltransferase
MSRTILARRVEEETLDHLREEDPRAIRSRRDLRRINRVMGNASILDSLLQDSLKHPPKRIAELGAGDGSLLLGIARRRARSWPGVALTLVDRQDLFDATARADFADCGWTATAAVMDVFDWLEYGAHRHYDAIVANLFVHHFEADVLRRLFRAIARITECFVACEPRRAQVAQLGSYLVGALGANAVTRRDAVLSVRAGFRDRELSACWPDDGEWRLSEGDARLFSHTFTAVRRERRG